MKMKSYSKKSAGRFLNSLILLLMLPLGFSCALPANLSSAYLSQMPAIDTFECSLSDEEYSYLSPILWQVGSINFEDEEVTHIWKDVHGFRKHYIMIREEVVYARRDAKVQFTHVRHIRCIEEPAHYEPQFIKYFSTKEGGHVEKKMPDTYHPAKKTNEWNYDLFVSKNDLVKRFYPDELKETNGIFIIGINSDAEKLGFRYGQIILKVDSKPIDNVDEFSQLIENKKIPHEIIVLSNTNGNIKKIMVPPRNGLIGLIPCDFVYIKKNEKLILNPKLRVSTTTADSVR